MPEANENMANASTGEQSAPGEVNALEAQPAPAQFEVGSYVTFGHYPQNNGDTPEPIEWLVLKNNNKTALIVSKYGLDCKQFHHNRLDDDVSWRNCDLRKWLNSDFLNKAFSSDEQERIVFGPIFTADNDKCWTEGCGRTYDKVFCLSIAQATKYFVSDALRKCRPTAYALSHRVWRNDDGYCWFWLRSPGFGDASDVSCNGAIRHMGCTVDSNRSAVRPALLLYL